MMATSQRSPLEFRCIDELLDSAGSPSFSSEHCRFTRGMLKTERIAASEEESHIYLTLGEKKSKREIGAPS